MIDFAFRKEGSSVLLQAVSQPAEDWVALRIPDALRFGVFAIEPRELADILAHIRDSRLRVIKILDGSIEDALFTKQDCKILQDMGVKL